MISLFFVSALFLLLACESCSASPFQHTVIGEVGRFPCVRLASFVLCPQIRTDQRHAHCSHKELDDDAIPFVETHVRHTHVERALEKKTFSGWPVSVKNLCAECFDGNFESLKRSFFFGGFSPNFFGVVCLLQKHALRTGMEFFPTQATLPQIKIHARDLQKRVKLYQRGIPDWPPFIIDIQQRMLAGTLLERAAYSQPNEASLVDQVANSLFKIWGGQSSTFFKEDVDLFLYKAKMRTQQVSRPRFSFSPVLNGVLFQACYQNGHLQQGFTKGGFSSEVDITRILQNLGRVPHVIPEMGDVTFQGVLSLTKKKLQLWNKQRLMQGKTPWFDPMSAIHGSLRWGGEAEVLNLNPDVFFLNTQGSGLPNWSHVKELKLPTLPSRGVFRGMHDDAQVALQNAVKSRFFCSGVNIVPKTGGKNKTCTYAAVPTFYDTTIQSIRFKRQETGVISAVLNVSPINVGGREIKHLVLPNKTDFLRLAPSMSDRLIVWAMPGLEPHIFTVIQSDSPVRVEFPSHCPQCEVLLDCQEVEGKKVMSCLAHGPKH